MDTQINVYYNIAGKSKKKIQTKCLLTNKWIKYSILMQHILSKYKEPELCDPIRIVLKCLILNLK